MEMSLGWPFRGLGLAKPVMMALVERHNRPGFRKSFSGDGPTFISATDFESKLRSVVVYGDVGGPGEGDNRLLRLNDVCTEIWTVMVSGVMVEDATR